MGRVYHHQHYHCCCGHCPEPAPQRPLSAIKFFSTFAAAVVLYGAIMVSDPATRWPGVYVVFIGAAMGAVCLSVYRHRRRQEPRIDPAPPVNPPAPLPSPLPQPLGNTTPLSGGAHPWRPYEGELLD